VKLRDVLFLCHAKPKNAEQAALWKKLVENTLELRHVGGCSVAGKDKRETWSGCCAKEAWWDGGAAQPAVVLAAGVAPKLVADRLEKGIARALPFGFVTAARHAPKPRKQSKKRC